MKNDPKVRNKVLVRFSEEEYSLVKENAAKCGLFIQNYFRLLIEGIRPTEKPDDDFFKLYHDLGKVSVNLMQIAYKAKSLQMREQDSMRKMAKDFNCHCTKLLHLMLRVEKP